MFGVYNEVRLPLEGMELGIRAGLPILGPPTGRIQPGPPKFVCYTGDILHGWVVNPMEQEGMSSLYPILPATPASS